MGDQYSITGLINQQIRDLQSDILRLMAGGCLGELEKELEEIQEKVEKFRRFVAKYNKAEKAE